jgi:peptide/nickel transport system substrate-binding protein
MSRVRGKHAVRLTGVAVLVAAGVLAIGLGSSAGAVRGHAARTTTLTLGWSQVVANTNPWTAQGQPLEVDQALYDTLLHQNAHGNAIPWLASAFKYTSPTTLVLTLRHGIKFTDGTPFNAAAVKANLIYGKTGTTGGGPFLQEITTITTSGPYQVKLALKAADPDLPYDFTQQSGWIVSPKALANPTSLQLTSDGTGPYVFDKGATTAGQVYTLTRNARYWAPKAFPFNTVVARAIPDQTTIDNLAQTGVLNLAVAVPPGTSISGWKISAASPVGLNGIELNDTTGKLNTPLKDVRVRQALNYAVNRAAIVKTVYHGLAIPAPSSPFTPSSAGWAAVKNFYPYDPAKAKKLLAAAGYPHGFTLKVLSLPPADFVTQPIAGYLRAVGVNLDIEDHTTDLPQQAQSGKWPAGAILITLTGHTFTDVGATMTPASFFNLLHITDPKITSFLKQIGSAKTTAARTSLYNQLARYTTGQAWFVAPALARGLVAFDPKEVAVTIQGGGAQPNLYDIAPAS